MIKFSQLFALVIAVAFSARADIRVIFDAPSQIGAPGDALQFFGNITNTGVDTVFLNGDIELFDISLSNPFTYPLGLYGGSYTLLGGVDGNAQDVLAAEDFSVTATPEPGLYGAVALGMGGLLLAGGRRHRTRE